MFQQISEDLLLRIHHFNAQSIANIVWAFAVTGQHSKALNDKIAGTLLLRHGDFNSHSISNTVWALAISGYDSSEFFRKIAKVVTPRLHEFNPLDITNIIDAYAITGHSTSKLLDEAANRVLSIVHEFRPHELSKTASAFATSGLTNPELFDTIALASSKQIDEFTTRNISDLAWAFATQNHLSPLLFDDITKITLSHIDELEPGKMSTIIWAYANLGIESTDLVDAILTRALSQLETFGPREFANLAWACAVFDHSSEVFFGSNPRFYNACIQHKESFQPSDLLKLHQCNLWREEKGYQNFLPSDLSGRCIRAFTMEGTNKSAAPLQDVVRVLTNMDVQFKEKYPADSGYIVDIMLRIKGHPIAVEVEGSTHRFGQPQHLTGSAKLKHRQLRKLDGLSLVLISDQEWRQVIQENASYQIQYLNRRLRIIT